MLPLPVDSYEIGRASLFPRIRLGRHCVLPLSDGLNAPSRGSSEQLACGAPLGPLPGDPAGKSFWRDSREVGGRTRIRGLNGFRGGARLRRRSRSPQSVAVPRTASTGPTVSGVKCGCRLCGLFRSGVKGRPMPNDLQARLNESLSGMSIRPPRILPVIPCGRRVETTSMNQRHKDTSDGFRWAGQRASGRVARRRLAGLMALWTLAVGSAAWAQRPVNLPPPPQPDIANPAAELPHPSRSDPSSLPFSEPDPGDGGGRTRSPAPPWMHGGSRW